MATARNTDLTVLAGPPEAIKLCIVQAPYVWVGEVFPSISMVVHTIQMSFIHLDDNK